MRNERSIRTLPLLAMVAGLALIGLEAVNGNALSFWSAVGLMTVVLAAVELRRKIK